jgi:hypothetical protein
MKLRPSMLVHVDFSFSERLHVCFTYSSVIPTCMIVAGFSRHCQPLTNEWRAVKDGCSMILSYTSLLSYLQ